MDSDCVQNQETNNENLLHEVKKITDLHQPIKGLKKSKKFIKKGLYLLNKGKDRTLLSDNLEEFYLCNQSSIIFIVNGGLTTGLDHVSVLELFISSGFKNIEDVVMVPGKQYSFVKMSKSSEAQNAVEALSGNMCIPATTNPLYMACINKVPELNQNTRYETPPGLILVEDFVTEEEENMLSSLIQWEDNPSHSSEGTSLKHRDVRHFGYEFKYSTNSIDKDNPLERPIPSELSHICQRLVDENLMRELPDQLTVNRYLPGQGIPSHVDTHSSFMGEIVSLSILGGIAMDFTLKEPSSVKSEDGTKKAHNSVYLPARSLCVMTGPSRYLWTHGICPRKTDIVVSRTSSRKMLLLKHRKERISFTFRKIRRAECKCPYPERCDSQNFGEMGHSLWGDQVRINVQLKSPEELEREHVLSVYEEIADHFSHTRHKPWPKVLEFVEALKPGTLMLDVGCGNGKYLGSNSTIFQLGTDTSEKLLEICSQRNFEAVLSNCLHLPFRENLFDAVICIAVIHHLASEDRRKRAVGEMMRVLRPGGRGLLYVWAMEQKRGKAMSTYLKQRRSNRKNETEALEGTKLDGEIHGKTTCSQREFPPRDILVHENRTDFTEQDLFVPWKIKHEMFQPKGSSTAVPIYHRYYHVFKEGEIADLFGEFSNLRVKDCYYDEGNWCLLFEKISLAGDEAVGS